MKPTKMWCALSKLNKIPIIASIHREDIAQYRTIGCKVIPVLVTPIVRRKKAKVKRG